MVEKWPEVLIAFLKKQVEFEQAARSEQPVVIGYGNNITEVPLKITG